MKQTTKTAIICFLATFAISLGTLHLLDNRLTNMQEYELKHNCKYGYNNLCK